MCGISGIVSSENIAKDLFASIRNLEYRGYDSCGLAVLKDGQIQIRKNTGTVEEVNAKEQLTRLKGNVGIAHTRWATHGGVTKANSHPHFSGDEAFAIVHNGIFSNYQDLREALAKQGVQFRSMTDSEVFAHLVEQAYEENRDVEQAFLQALHRVEGAFAIALISKHMPDTLFCAKQDSPLILGIGDGKNFIGSDINAFLAYTKQAVTLDDGEYAAIRRTSYYIKKVGTGKPVKKKMLIIDWDVETTKKGGYSHYMLKEIFDQPNTAKQALQIALSEIKQLVHMINKSKICYLMGVGTTYYVALVGQYYFAQFADRYIATGSSDEFQEAAVVTKDDLVVAISQSGETYDTKMGLGFAQSHNAKTAGIVNVMGSTISMMVDHVIMQGSGPEICVVSTKAAFSQMIILMRVAIEIALLKEKITKDAYEEYYAALNDFPEIIERVLNEQSGFVRNLAVETSHIPNWIFLGCGVYYPIAMESALKMKEVTYLHAEGMPGGFLKHGTLAMIDEKLYSLFFIPLPEQEELHKRTLVAIEEIKARGGTVLGFAFQNDEKAEKLLDYIIQLPKVHPLVAPLLELIVAQLLSYYTALDLGRNIDKPRNLAKSVTVA